MKLLKMHSKEYDMADDFVTVKLIITNPKTNDVTKEMQIQKGMEIRTSKNNDKKHQSIYTISEKMEPIKLDSALAGSLEAISGLDGDNKLSINDAVTLSNAQSKDMSVFMNNAQEKAKQNGSVFSIDGLKKGANSITVDAKDPQTFDSTGLEIKW